MKAELIEIRFDLPPQKPGGKNRASYIEVLQPDGSKHKLTFTEPLKNIRTVRDEYWVIQKDEAPRTSFWIRFIRSLRNLGFGQTINGKEVLMRSQVSCFDTRTGQLESRKLDIFPVAPYQLGFTKEEEFNASGHPFKDLVVLWGPSGRPRQFRKKLFDWVTGIPVTTKEYYPLAPNGSVSLEIKTFDPETGVAQEQLWTTIREGVLLEKNSGRCLTHA